MQIHLCKPGGAREGPYTLEQIKRDLAANKYSDTDYWAWHEGLSEWVPLYALPGIAAIDDAAPPESESAGAPASTQVAPSPAATPAVAAAPAPVQPKPRPVEAPRAVAPATTASVTREAAPIAKLPAPASEPAAPGMALPPVAPVPEPEAEAVAARTQVSSGMPVGALEQVFMFTTGDGPSAWQSPTVARMLKEITGEEVSGLRDNVQRDVVAWCAVSQLLNSDGSLSDSVWRAMTAHRPELIQQAKERLYRVCVRTFRIEADATVALVLFYNKQKL